MTETSSNLVQWLLDRHVESGQGQQCALIDDTKTWSYDTLYDLSHTISGHCCGISANAGDFVAIIARDHGLAVATLLGIIRSGRVACCLNPDLTSTEIKRRLTLINPVAVLVDDQGLSHAPTLDQGPWTLLKLTDLKETGAKPYTHEGPMTRFALCLFTSGTTGHAQAVPHRHQDPLVMNEHYGRGVLGLNQDIVTFSPSKLYFAYGLNSVLFALYQGGTARITVDKPKGAQAWDMIADSQANVVFGVPRFYQHLFNDTDKRPKHLPALLVSAGERLPKPLMETCLDCYQRPIIDGIGTTEVLSTFISNAPDDWHMNTTGRLVPGFKAQIKDQKDPERVVQSGETGVLWLYGDTYYPGYINDAAGTKASFHQGWFITNDLFSQDDKGYFYYQGRVSDSVVLNGAYFSPYALEDVLLAHPDVSDCALVSVSKAKRQWLRLVVVPKVAPSGQLKTALNAYIQPHLPWPLDELVFMASIPATPAGKKQRYLLKAPDISIYESASEP